MKRKLLFAMLCIVSVLGLRAQTDVTSTYINNADFEGSYSKKQDSGQSGCAIYQPENWEIVYSNGNEWDRTAVKDNDDSNFSNYTNGTQTFRVRFRWGSNTTIILKQSATLPEGYYRLTANTVGTNSGGNISYLFAGSNKVAIAASNDYATTTTVTFTINESSTIDLGLEVARTAEAEQFAGVDNFVLTYSPITRPTAISVADANLNLTEVKQLTVNYTPADANTDTDITWESSDPTVATVSATGLVTALKEGSTTITATTANSVSTTCTVTVTDVTPVAAPAYYSEVAAGDFYIVNAATGKYLGGANSWGTHASQIEHGIPFTVAVSDGKYTLDSHTYNNEAEHFFTGTFVDGASTNLYITSLGSGKYSISTADGSAFVTANVNDNVVANTAANANSVLAQWYFVSKVNRDALFANATDAAPADATYYLTEANISRNLRKAYNTSAWTGTFSYGGANENQCAERYRANTDVYQTVTVPNGKYTVSCQGFYRRESGEATSYLYANDEQVALNRIESGGVNSMAGASEAFTNGEYTNTLTVYVTDGTLKVGIKCDATTNWTIWDNFTIAYHGPTVGGEATEIAMDTETAMTAGKWYYFDIPVDGLYNLTTTTLPDIVYTNDATVLIENESSVTATFSQAVNETLTAGRYFVKSASAQSLELSVGAYAYNVGDATLSVADGGYTQSSTFTVTFPAAATSDPAGETTLAASSKATVNGAEVALAAVTNGFSLDLGSLTANTDYVIAIPADVYGYAGESMNSAINVTLHTPAVFDGEYVFYDATNSLFLGRGAGYGTEATADKYGIPVNLTTDATGASNVQFIDNDGYLFIASNGVFTDGGTFTWTVNSVTGGYTLSGVFNAATKYLTHAAGDFGEYVTTTDVAGSATVWTLKTLAERDAIIAEYPTENINNVITASGAATTADAFATYLSTNYNAEDLTSVVGTASFAGAAGGWTWTGYWRNQDGQPAYGTGFVEAWNATGAWSQTVDKANLPAGIYKVTVQGFERRCANAAAETLKSNGYNLVSTFLSANGEQVRFTDWNDVAGKPTNTTDATTAFGSGEATNELYVYLDGNTDLNLMVRKPNYIWDCWIIWNNITLTRYSQTSANMTIAAGKYGTFVAPFDVTIPSGVTAQKVTGVTGATLNFEDVTTTIPANTPVVVSSDADVNETFYGKDNSAGAETVTAGKLVGIYKAVEIPAGCYVLQTQGDVQAFYKLATAATANTLNRAYLNVDASVKAFFFNDEDADGINAVEATAEDGRAIYNLAGQRVKKAQKGLYIIGGKTVLVK